MSDWPRPVVRFLIQAQDLEKQRAFYAAMFDWDITAPFEGAPFLDIPEGKGPPPDGVGGTMIQDDKSNVTIYLQVADLPASLKQADELGGKAIMQPVDVPDGPTIAQIEDPEGNVLGLVQM